MGEIHNLEHWKPFDYAYNIGNMMHTDQLLEKGLDLDIYERHPVQPCQVPPRRDLSFLWVQRLIPQCWELLVDE
jgi:hypothetical protein